MMMVNPEVYVVSPNRDVPTNSLEFVNDVDIPGNNFFYGTDDAGIKNWIDFDDDEGEQEVETAPTRTPSKPCLIVLN